MLGINFLGFLILLIISIIVSILLHFVFNSLVREGFESFVSKVVIGWIGAWLGSPVFGHWFEGLAYNDIYIIPAILGSFALIILMVDLVKTVKTAE